MLCRKAELFSLLMMIFWFCLQWDWNIVVLFIRVKVNLSERLLAI
nr:hypothetical protein [Microcystis wesenbergii]